ncbi:MAG: LysR family transcriptional regulator [Gammaproteobacteria bacterium]|nr:LysR family transcriptional regulator [Gammaproteobacteria bacterium]MCW9057675.1 LysR family transcriptional regulator [Gammaproteobacteria bacterium]
MDTGLLKAFLEVQRTRHFGRAAANLFLSQSTVSARIRQLEEELGTHLFIRQRKHIELTPAGRKFLAFAENMINTWNRAQQEISVPEGMHSLLAIAALPSLWDAFLEDWLRQLPALLPELALRADAGDTDSLLRQLQEGTLDLALLFDPPETARFQLRELAPLPLVLVSTQAGQTSHEAMRTGYVWVDWGTSFAGLHARRFPDLPAPRLRVSVGRLALGYILENGGAAYLPEPMVRGELGRRLFPVEDTPIIRKETYAVYARSTDREDVIERVIDSLPVGGSY